MARLAHGPLATQTPEYRGCLARLYVCLVEGEDVPKRETVLYTPSTIGSVPAEGLDPRMGGLVLCISPSSAGSIAAGLPHARLGKAAGGAATEGEAREEGEALNGKRHRPTRKLPGP